MSITSQLYVAEQYIAELEAALAGEQALNEHLRKAGKKMLSRFGSLSDDCVQAMSRAIALTPERALSKEEEL